MLHPWKLWQATEKPSYIYFTYGGAKDTRHEDFIKKKFQGHCDWASHNAPVWSYLFPDNPSCIEMRKIVEMKDGNRCWKKTGFISVGIFYRADLGTPHGSIQGGARPVINIRNNARCFFSSALIVISLIMALKKLNQSAHYIMNCQNGLNVG